ncbi:hypothetical protein M408DRAFT_293605 [Serendipita vermifera MAFF 305830]|uniref:Uncharacterized protein n=1 Tax=Serendipita vermifera MAFF 305830 TaxID=933852 RepID=A0A0C3ABY1_SERVB|nr:hypothetical protein M408DRAFT_293605 [Serendipita vermifera MAFF 305830]
MANISTSAIHEEREAYTPPIYRISYDILSAIFVDLCHKDASTPLRLQAVCRSWRDILLGTPLAWARIPVGINLEGRHYDLICTYLERSHNLPLHLHIDALTDSRIIEKLRESADRVRCFQGRDRPISRIISPPLTFSNLEKLSMYGTRTYKDYLIAGWNMGMFPNLTSLDICWSDEYLKFISTSTGLPPLTELVVSCENTVALDTILDKCSQSLRLLHVTTVFQSPTEDRQRVLRVFPNLCYLNLGFHSSSPKGSSWSFNGLAPNLEFFYGEGIAVPPVDIYGVTALGIDQQHDLSTFSKLKMLYIAGEPVFALDVIRDLNDRPWLCPELSQISVERHLETIKEAAELLNQRAKTTGRKVEMDFGVRRINLLDQWRETMNVDQPTSFVP